MQIENIELKVGLYKHSIHNIELKAGIYKHAIHNSELKAGISAFRFKLNNQIFFIEIAVVKSEYTSLEIKQGTVQQQYFWRM